MKCVHFLSALAITFILTTHAFAQFNKGLRHAEKSDSSMVEVTIKPAEFPGGMEKLLKYLSKRTKLPTDARDRKVKGRVVVEFVIDSIGNIKKESVKVIQSLFESCDKEAVQLVKNFPAWIPAIDLKTNKKTECRYALPIFFVTKD